MKHDISLRRKSLTLVLLSMLCTLPVFLFQCKKDKLPLNGDPEQFTYLAENLAPFNYLENGQMNGISVDILEKMFSGLDVAVNRSAITVSDQAAAYATTKTTQGTMLLSTVKNTENAGLFKWVGPIGPRSEVVLYLKSSNITLKEITDLNNYFTGVVDGSGSIDLLMDRGIFRANIIVYGSQAELYKALVDNREIQCISTSESGHNLMVQALGYPATDFALPFAVHTDQLYYAFNIETTDEMIMNFQGQLDSLKMNNSGGSSDYEDILDRYARVKEATDGITSEMAINLVDRTALDLQADGPGTLARINQGLAPYKDATNSSLFTYVYDKQAVIIANADDQSLTNISLSGKTDVAGKKYHDEIIKGAIENGTGWVDYIYTRPDQDGLYLRTVYYKMVTASNAVQFVVCCGRMGKRDA